MADAATVTAEAVVRMAGRDGGKAMLGKVSKVRLVEGHRPGAELQQGVMQITIAPADGLAGRPSSERIMSVVTR